MIDWRLATLGLIRECKISAQYCQNFAHAIKIFQSGTIRCVFNFNEGKYAHQQIAQVVWNNCTVVGVRLEFPPADGCFGGGQAHQSSHFLHQ